MQDMHAKLEKLLTEAEDCDIIGRLATAAKKRELKLLGVHRDGPKCPAEEP